MVLNHNGHQLQQTWPEGPHPTPHLSKALAGQITRIMHGIICQKRKPLHRSQGCKEEGRHLFLSVHPPHPSKPQSLPSIISSASYLQRLSAHLRLSPTQESHWGGKSNDIIGRASQNNDTKRLPGNGSKHCGAHWGPTNYFGIGS